jgi:hypothetical protein
MDRSLFVKSLDRTTRSALYLAALLAVVACGDSPMAPKSMDPDAVARVMPSLIDAEQRLAPRLVTAAVRQVVALEIRLLRVAMVENNVHQARLSIGTIGDALTGVAAHAAVEDAADLTAIELMLYAVAPVVDGARTDIRFKASP